MEIILGIESSCDETGVAIVTSDRRVLAESLASQQADHAPFGGVIPELAARRHLEILPDMIANVSQQAGVKPADVTAIAATCGPGLIGGLLVGAMFGKGMAAALKKPFIAINHLEAHALSPRLIEPNLPFPYLLLLISGGHTQLLICEGVGRYRRLGTTLDDAAGECFDKCASVMGLGQPGGPVIEKAAMLANAHHDHGLPRPLWRQKNCDFSFSGLKTAVARQCQSPFDVNNLAWAVQRTIADSLADRTRQAMRVFMETHPDAARHMVVAGGVAANKTIAESLTAECAAHGFALHVPPAKLCTDNGVMIAWAGWERYAARMIDPLDVKVRPRWPLDPIAAKEGARA